MTGQYSGAKIPFHAEAALATATDATFTIYGAHSTSALTLAVGDYVVVTDALVSSDTAGTLSVYGGDNTTLDAGEAITSLQVSINDRYTASFVTPHECEAVIAGWLLRLKSSASATAKAQVKGYIIAA